MNKLSQVTALFLVAACGTSSETSTATETPAAPKSASVDAAASGAPSFDAEIVKTATSAKELKKMKVRVNERGQVIKQSLYHGDASAVPAAVQDLVAKEFAGASPVHYETEWYADLGRVFEVEVKTKEGKQCELAASPEGQKHYVECRIEAGELPAPVSATVKQISGDAKVLEAERKQSEGGEEFSVEVETAEGELYILVAADGKLKGKYRRIPGIIEVPLP